jgi:hypothetical protein
METPRKLADAVADIRSPGIEAAKAAVANMLAWFPANGFQLEDAEKDWSEGQAAGIRALQTLDVADEAKRSDILTACSRFTRLQFEPEIDENPDWVFRRHNGHFSGSGDGVSPTKRGDVEIFKNAVKITVPEGTEGPVDYTIAGSEIKAAREYLRACEDKIDETVKASKDLSEAAFAVENAVRLVVSVHKALSRLVAVGTVFHFPTPLTVKGTRGNEFPVTRLEILGTPFNSGNWSIKGDGVKKTMPKGWLAFELAPLLDTDITIEKVQTTEED